MKTIITILATALSALPALAQRNCGSQDYISHLIQINPSAAVSIQQAERQVATTLKNKDNYAARDTFSNELINIPVVIHVLYNSTVQNISDAQIQSQLTVLNNDFANLNADKSNRPAVFAGLAADIRIKFCLAQVDPKGKRTTGVIRKQTNNTAFTIDDAMKSNMRGGDDAWDCKKYLNIWVCNLSGRTLGYAAPPGSPAELDGVVISFDVFGTVGNLRVPYNKGRTATHEVGHWLGLKHLWGDTECGNDGVDDTPRQRSYNYGCPSFPHITECSETGNGDMFMNYMDFSDDACMNMFTMGQKKRMRALFANGNQRNSFLASFACDSTLVQAGPVDNDTTVITPVAKTDVFKVYPNPVQSVLNIDYKAATEMIAKPFVVYNTIGIKVLSGELSKDKTSINIAGLLQGVYIVRIGEGKDAFVAKIFKQ